MTLGPPSIHRPTRTWENNHGDGIWNRPPSWLCNDLCSAGTIGFMLMGMGWNHPGIDLDSVGMGMG